MNTKGVFSSKSNEWTTPQYLFDQLDAEFHFNLDPASTDENHKCAQYFTKADDGLKKSWGGEVSILQSAIRQTDWQVGGKGISRSPKAQHNSGYADPGEDGYGLVSRPHLRQSGNTIYQRASAIRRQQDKCSVSVNDRDMAQTPTENARERAKDIGQTKGADDGCEETVGVGT